MTVLLKKPAADSIPLHAVDTAGFEASSACLGAASRQWLATLGFKGAPDSHALLPWSAYSNFFTVESISSTGMAVSCTSRPECCTKQTPSAKTEKNFR